MNISSVIEETAKYLYKYNRTFRPENEIYKYLHGKGNFYTQIEIKREVDKIYREGQSFFYPDKEYLYISDIRSILSKLSELDCINFSIQFSQKIDDPSLFNKISHYYDDQLPPIRQQTRKKIANILPNNVFGEANTISNELSKNFLLTSDFNEQTFANIDELFTILNVYKVSTAVLM